MTIITELANGNTEIFETNSFVISKTKDFHPNILKVKVYSGNKKIKSKIRPFCFFYKHFVFKSKRVQEQLREIEQQFQNNNNT